MRRVTYVLSVCWFFGDISLVLICFCLLTYCPIQSNGPILSFFSCRVSTDTHPTGPTSRVVSETATVFSFFFFLQPTWCSAPWRSRSQSHELNWQPEWAGGWMLKPTQRDTHVSIFDDLCNPIAAAPFGVAGVLLLIIKPQSRFLFPLLLIKSVDSFVCMWLCVRACWRSCALSIWREWLSMDVLKSRFLSLRLGSYCRRCIAHLVITESDIFSVS